MINNAALPLPPAKSAWKFIEDLRAPIHRTIKFPKRRLKPGEAGLGDGMCIEAGFPNPGGSLDTAYSDFNDFFHAAGLSTRGTYRIITRTAPTDIFEEFKILVRKERCEIKANDPEGIRRALVYLEDEMLRRGGPILPLGFIARKPVIRTRLSKSFFAPTNRPPHFRDELADEADYYPDGLLNRMAHDGVNGVWVVVRLRELCPSRLIPEYGRDGLRRLEKLRRTAERCARYGIQVFPFCIDPEAFRADDPVLAAHPALAGHRDGNTVFFCTSASMGQAYLEDATQTLFSAVPTLGGLIVLSVGESGSHCYSACTPEVLHRNHCPRCAKKKPWEVLNDIFTAFRRGIDRVNPQAELISWPYGQFWYWDDENLIPKAAANVAAGTTLMHNFESSSRVKQLGKVRRAYDYWLSFPGPSALFRQCARAARVKGTPLYAKLQVGCSHEVASVPCVPVPGILYRKYRAMHALGVRGAFYGWHTGNYPSIMTKAAGELAFAPLPKTEDEFLLRLARRDWGPQAPRVVKAWKHFQDGYANYPVNHQFGWSGPMHDGPAWPLHLVPRDTSTAPTHEFDFPPSGDRIGRCFAFTHTLEEVLALCQRMAAEWNRGVEILRKLKNPPGDPKERARDIGLAAALGCLFQSGYDILRFYALREELFRSPGIAQPKILERMRRVARHEIQVSEELWRLSGSDHRLGFHSEACGYKFYPAKLAWRVRQLKELLRKDFPSIAGQIRMGRPLFPAYTGEKPAGGVYRCRRFNRAPAWNGKPVGPPWDELEEARCGTATPGKTTRWKAGYWRAALYVGVVCEEPRMETLRTGQPDRKMYGYGENDGVEITIEPRRLWPCHTYVVNAAGARFNAHDRILDRDYRWKASAHREDGFWSVVVKIPFSCLRIEPFTGRPLRANISRIHPGAPRDRWISDPPPPENPQWNYEYPEALGWLVFG